MSVKVAQKPYYEQENIWIVGRRLISITCMDDQKICVISGRLPDKLGEMAYMADF